VLVDKKAVILCVDDEENALLLRRLILEREGYEVVTALSGKQALEIVLTHSVDLLLSDHLMPGLSGADLARDVKAICPGLPVILLSGVNEIPNDAGYADLFLSKLEGPARLCESISLLLSRGGRMNEGDS
jgi:CheY-like chemotaxis protein